MNRASVRPSAEAAGAPRAATSAPGLLEAISAGKALVPVRLSKADTIFYMAFCGGLGVKGRSWSPSLLTIP